MADTFGMAISETSVPAFTHEAAEALQPICQQIGQAVQAAPVTCAEETGIRSQVKLEWLRCAVTPSLSCPEHHPKRGMSAIEAIGILPQVKDTLLQGKKEVDERHAPLPPQGMQWYEAKWRTLLGCGELLYPRREPDGRLTTRRGKHRHDRQFTLLARLRQYKADVWRFATHVGVPFTNNLAEQALMMPRCARKSRAAFARRRG